MSNANKGKRDGFRELQDEVAKTRSGTAMASLVPDVAQVQVLVVDKQRGGIAIAEATVPASAITIHRQHPPDVIDIAMSRLERLVQVIARGGK